MADLFPKFIIENDSLIMMKVSFHKHMILDPANSEIKGGGWFRYDNENKRFIFYGDSTDFGAAKLEDIKKCVEDNKIFSNPYSDESLTEHGYKFAYDTGTEIIPLN
jgi:hypothetical protein